MEAAEEIAQDSVLYPHDQWSLGSCCPVVNCLLLSARSPICLASVYMCSELCPLAYGSYVLSPCVWLYVQRTQCEPLLCMGLVLAIPPIVPPSLGWLAAARRRWSYGSTCGVCTLCCVCRSVRHMDSMPVLLRHCRVGWCSWVGWCG